MTNAVGTAILIWYGSSLIINETITIGVFVSFAFYLGMFWEPISRLGQVYNQLLMGMASSERIFEFLDEKPSVADKEDAVKVKELKGHIEFDDVEFSYDGKRKALHRISFEIPAGTSIALVGHTGSGKTTIASLISRFYDATSGTVKADGIPITDISLDDLRSQISIVLQDTFIFQERLWKISVLGGRTQLMKKSLKQLKPSVPTLSFQRFQMGMPQRSKSAATSYPRGAAIDFICKGAFG